MVRPHPVFVEDFMDLRVFWRVMMLLRATNRTAKHKSDASRAKKDRRDKTDHDLR